MGVSSPTEQNPRFSKNLAIFNADIAVWRAAARSMALLMHSPEIAAQMRVRATSESPSPADPNDVGAIQQIFERFDSNRDGALDTSELRDALIYLGADQATVEVMVENCIASMDLSGDRRVQLNEFISGFASPLFADSKEALHAAFCLFDTDRNGTIDCNEFEAMVCKLGMSPVKGKNDPEAVARMFRSADKNGNGKVSFQEFVEAVTSKSSTMVQDATLGRRTSTAGCYVTVADIKRRKGDEGS